MTDTRSTFLNEALILMVMVAHRFRTDSAGSTPARSRSKKARAATGAAARAFNAAEDEHDDPECVPPYPPGRLLVGCLVGQSCCFCLWLFSA